MNVIIPSYRRAGRVDTIEALKGHGDITLVVRHEEYAEYFQAHGSSGVRVLKLPADVDTLLKTRQWIWEHCVGPRKTVLCDDDIQAFYVRRSDDGTYVPCTRDEVGGMLAAMEAELELADVAVVGPRGKGTPPQPGPRKGASDLRAFIAVDGRKLEGRGLRWDRVEWCEDRDFVMQVLALGLDCVHLQGWSFQTPSLGQGQGGLQTGGLTWGDRERLAREGMANLARLWPQYVLPSERGPHGYEARRSNLLRDARRKMEADKKTCPGCDCPAGLNGLCPDCEKVVQLVDGSAGTLRRLADHLTPRKPKEKADGKRGRGRPAMSENHPVIQKMKGRGQFRVDEVAEFYKSRSSAQVSLHNMVRRGLLLRLRAGVFQVVEPSPLTPEELREAQARSAPGPDTPNLNRWLKAHPTVVSNQEVWKELGGSPETWDEPCYCMSQAMTGKSEACVYCQERLKKAEELATDRNPNVPGKMGDV